MAAADSPITRGDDALPRGADSALPHCPSTLPHSVRELTVARAWMGLGRGARRHMAHTASARSGPPDRDQLLVGLICLVSAVSAVFAAARPTGRRAVDIIFLLGFGALVPLA